MTNIEEVKDNQGNIIAIIIPKDFKAEGTSFFTPNDFGQQMALIQREKGEIIKSHTHKPINVNINSTQESLFIRKGKVKVDLYDTKKELITSRNLEAGDVILLASGGHGFEALEELEMIEVKQGPYLSDDYKEIYDTSK